MRLCRYEYRQRVHIGIYADERILPWDAAVRGAGVEIPLSENADLMPLLPPDGLFARPARNLDAWVRGAGAEDMASAWLPTSQVQLKVPLPRPPKLLLLAGNYAAHIEEGGGKAVERAETFPYVFMKPPSTTLRDPGAPFYLPSVSPQAVDYELELAVIMGRTGKGIPADEALGYVAGYTVVNDISDRQFRPCPERRERPRDGFFDWLHGKWHDGSCPCGPCVVSADAVADPQQLAMRLTVNDEIRQDASTELQIFTVAEVIAFISSFVTLEAGDIISTGTCAGVGGPRGIFLHAGDIIQAQIDGIGTLTTPVAAP